MIIGQLLGLDVCPDSAEAIADEDIEGVQGGAWRVQQAGQVRHGPAQGSRRPHHAWPPSLSHDMGLQVYRLYCTSGCAVELYPGGTLPGTQGGGPACKQHRTGCSWHLYQQSVQKLRPKTGPGPVQSHRRSHHP